jgi:hypothetical protein
VSLIKDPSLAERRPQGGADEFAALGDLARSGDENVLGEREITEKPVHFDGGLSPIGAVRHDNEQIQIAV